MSKKLLVEMEWERNPQAEERCRVIYNLAMEEELGIERFKPLEPCDFEEAMAGHGRCALALAKDESGEIRGFSMVAGEIEQRGGWALMQMLAVEPGSQGQGVGKALMDAALEMARQMGASGLRAGVRCESKGSQAFYRSRRGRVDVSMRALDAQGEPVHIVSWALAPKPAMRMKC